MGVREYPVWLFVFQFFGWYQVRAFCAVAGTMGKLEVGYVRWMTAFIYRDDVVYAGTHGMGGPEGLVNWLPTNSADILRCKYDLLVGFELCAVWSIAVRAINRGSPSFI